MRSARQRSGDAAEAAVLRAAKRRGLACLARNFRARRGELDLVLHGKDLLVIIEVRYRARGDYGSAAETVSATKQARIVFAARAFLQAHPRYADTALRFDVVGVDAEGGLDWIENAFVVDGP